MEEARLFLAALFLLIAQLVYWDATRNNIGKAQGEKGFLNMPAGGWAALSSFSFLAIGPITWILYLVNRKKLLAKANKTPVILSKSNRILVHASLIAIPLGLGYLATPRSTVDETTVGEELKLAAAELNKQLPQQLDDITRLDNITVNDRDMMYHYTVDTKPSNKNSIMEFVKANVAKGQCGDKKTLDLIRESKVSYSYEYKLSDGSPLFQVHLDERACKEAGY